jgi:hypothetical protein
MTRESCIANHVFWDRTNHDRITIELHRFKVQSDEDPNSKRIYVFYKSKLVTIRSVPATIDPTVANRIHRFFGSLHPDVESLEDQLDDWLESNLAGI